MIELATSSEVPTRPSGTLEPATKSQSDALRAFLPIPVNGARSYDIDSLGAISAARKREIFYRRTQQPKADMFGPYFLAGEPLTSVNDPLSVR